ncbi:MAG: hypothetical protein E6590_18175 [Clostridiales bacterium]|nr:hypothetical protein [Clostridiales bacterium]
MSRCKHEYESEISPHSESGLIWVCKKCGQVKPYKRKETYIETILRKYSRNK